MATDRAKVVKLRPVVTDRKEKENFYDSESILPLFPFVSPNHPVFTAYQIPLRRVNIVQRFCCARSFLSCCSIYTVLATLSWER